MNFPFPQFLVNPSYKFLCVIEKVNVKKSVFADPVSRPPHALLLLLAKINYAPSLFHINARLSAYRPEATNDTQRLICRTHSQVNATLVCLKCRQTLCRHMDPYADNALKEPAHSDSDNHLSKYSSHRLMRTTYKHPSKEYKLLCSTFS